MNLKTFITNTISLINNSIYSSFSFIGHPIGQLGGRILSSIYHPVISKKVDSQRENRLIQDDDSNSSLRRICEKKILEKNGEDDHAIMEVANINIYKSPSKNNSGEILTNSQSSKRTTFELWEFIKKKDQRTQFSLFKIERSQSSI